MASASDVFLRHAAGIDPATGARRQRIARARAPRDVIGSTVRQGAEAVGAGLGFLYGGGPGGALAGRSAAKTLTGGIDQAGRGDVIGGASNVGMGLTRGSTIATSGERQGGILPTPTQFTPSSLTPQRLIQPKGTFAQAASAGAGLGGTGEGRPSTGGAASIGAAAGALPLAEQGLGALQKELGGTSAQLPTTVGQGTKLSQGEVAELISILS
jgi:hypothetical protein